MFTEQGFVQIELSEVSYSQIEPPTLDLRLVSAQCIGNIYGQNTLRFNLDYKDPDKIYSSPTLIKGIGPSLGAAYITNPELQYSFNGVTGRNNDWTDSQSGIISSTSKAPVSSLESAVFTGINKGTNFVYLKQTGNLTYSYEKGAIEISSIDGSLNTGFNESRTVISGQSSGWASFDISSGVNNKKVFAYSLSILDRISGVSGVEGLDVLALNNTGIQFNDAIPNHPGIIISFSGENRVGYCSTSSLFIGESGACIVPAAFLERLSDNEPSEVCLPSGLSSGALRSAIEQFIQTQILINSSVGEVIAGEDPSTAFGLTASNYTVYNGYITLDRPYSGDSIVFKSYNLEPNYSGLYYNTYENYPPYPETGFTLTYPTDFTGTADLTVKINNYLLNNNFTLWYPLLDQFSDNPSGHFETGSLLRATYINDSTIHIESTRIGSAGNYKFDIVSGARPQQKTPTNVIKFMLPNRVTLQGANTFGSWTDLHTVSNLSWGKIVPETSIKQFESSITGISGRKDPQVQTTTIDSIQGIPAKQLKYSTVISGVTKCGTPYSERVDFYTIDSGLGNSCVDSENDAFSDNLQSYIPAITQTGSNMGSHYFLKTGWSFNNSQNYNLYRVVLSDFKSDTRSINQAVIDEFYVSNLALFGYESGVSLQTGSTSILGATYSGKIEGVTTGIITGRATGYANSTTSGLVVFKNAFVTGVPNGNNIVKFQSHSGVGTTPFTGLLNVTITGTGYYEDNVCGYFYESGVTGVSFVKIVSGIISGSGELVGGPYNIISETSNITGSQFVTGFGGNVCYTNPNFGLASGIIPNFTFPFTDIPAFYYHSGVLVGSPTSGFLIIDSGISIFPAIAYQFDVTGYRAASALLNYSAPQEGDTVLINNSPIIYTTNPIFNAPSYFKSITELKDIINSGSGYFLVTGEVNGSNILIRALDLGLTGNGIPLSSDGSVGKPVFSNPVTSGGDTYYRPISPTGAFTGRLQRTEGSTGIYSRTGVGNISGTVKNLDFVREFSGVWNLVTGDIDFRESGWLSNFSYDNSSFVPSGFFQSNPSNIDLSVLYLNDPAVITTDMAILTITGLNFNSGLSIIISGKQ